MFLLRSQHYRGLQSDRMDWNDCKHEHKHQLLITYYLLDYYFEINKVLVDYRILDSLQTTTYP